tara:strand:- start:559 stop:813 length:255 start_codon:yes stop_codon:yes gene_type:complete
MGSIDRKIKRKKQRETKKKSEKIMKEVGAAISSMPSYCHVCNVELNKSDTASLDKWRIKIFETGRVELTCGECHEKIENQEEGT